MIMESNTGPRSDKMSEEKRLATEEHLDSRIMEFLKPRMGARFKTWMNICAHCALCSDTCHFYLISITP